MAEEIVAVSATGRDLSSAVDPRFGRSAYFIIIEGGSGDFRAIGNEAVSMPGGAGIQVAQMMVDLGVNVVLTGNVGPNAFRVLNAAGIRVLTGCAGSVKDALEAYRSGRLSEGGPAAVGGRRGGRGLGQRGGFGQRPGGGRGIEE